MSTQPLDAEDKVLVDVMRKFIENIDGFGYVDIYLSENHSAVTLDGRVSVTVEQGTLLDRLYRNRGEPR